MIPLHLRQVLRETGVVEGVVHAVVEDVEGECTSDDTIRDRLGEDGMRKTSKRRLQDEEEERRHDKTEAVHGKVVVHTVKKEVEHEGPVAVREVVVQVEEEAVKDVLQQRPDQVTREEAGNELDHRASRHSREEVQLERPLKDILGNDPRIRKLQERKVGDEGGNRGPDDRHDIPLRASEHLVNVSAWEHGMQRAMIARSGLTSRKSGPKRRAESFKWRGW